MKPVCRVQYWAWRRHDSRSRAYSERTPHKFVVYRPQGRRDLGINRAIQEPGQMAQNHDRIDGKFSLHKTEHFKASTVLTYCRIRLGHTEFCREKCHLSTQILTVWFAKGNVFQTHLWVQQHLQIPKLIFPCYVNTIYVPICVQSGECGG